MKAEYPFSLYCECGTTVQFSALLTDTATAALMEQVMALHAGHEKVSAAEARRIRYYGRGHSAYDKRVRVQ